jgi:galactose oxidase-like protein
MKPTTTVTPTPRGFTGLAYDEARAQLVMFGGTTNGGTVVGDFWSWDGTTWTPRVPATLPPPRDQHGMTYDPARHEIVVFGGVGLQNTMLDDTWVWNGVDWQQRSPAHSPPATGQPIQLVFDRARERAVMLDDQFNVWEWDGTDWTEHSVDPRPPVTSYAQLAYEVLSQRVVLFGGERDSNGTQLFDETWQWDGTAWSRRLPTITAPARSKGAMTFDALSGRLVLASGREPATLPGTWTYGYSASEVPPDRCIAGTDTDGDGKAGCDDPDCWARCTPTCAPGETCDPAAPHCGDGTCSAVEDYVICPADCPAP